MRRYAIPVLLLVLAVAMVVPLSGCGTIARIISEQLPQQAEPAEPAPANVGEEPAATDAGETGSDGAYAVGDSVAAVWDDGNLYLANVTGVEGDQITVRYVDDASTKTVPSADVRPVEVREWAVGDRVLAVWSLGRFYPGEITQASDPDYTVKWDDGSAPTKVTADRIISEK